ncbi:PREDICTED: taste receptor type 2 member 8-like [Chinchilla lanigera]|uniref:taste receptor type 2 member 8-like n=1 Tax=Chinchilla lanigera TaxID=34839 RepID=UPI00038ED1A8|nr:PREDICTED: taste receptor type 2 member 8-like [Chinchilla lanigera]
MSSILETLSMVISIVEFIMGIFGNGFIVLINGIDWVRKRKTSLFDFILTSLASSRLCFLCSTFSTITFSLVYGERFYFKSILMGVSVFWTGSTYSCTACTTCLTVFYFFKITNFSSPIFLWMKHRMHMVLLIIVLGSALSFCVSLFFMDTFINMSVQYWVNRKQNFTFYDTKSLDYLVYYSLLHMALFISFVVSLSSFLLLLFSLWNHTKRMKLQGMYSRDSSMEAHVRAMKAMISSLLLFVTNFVSNVMVMLAYIADSEVAKVFAHLLIFLYPSAHPFLLILWNNKLKHASLCVLRKLKCVGVITHSHE